MKNQNVNIIKTSFLIDLIENLESEKNPSEINLIKLKLIREILNSSKLLDLRKLQEDFESDYYNENHSKMKDSNNNINHSLIFEWFKKKLI